MSKKNIILILTDQMRFDCVGVNGNKQIQTPFLDNLANNGINFNNAHSANPSCIAARASILTGKPGYKTGFYGYHDCIPWEFKDTLVDNLNNRGYKTINVGKTHFYPQENNMNFSVNKLYDPQKLDKGFKSDYHKWLEEVNPSAEDPALICDNNGWPIFEWQEKSYYHPTEWTLRTGLDEISKCDGNPFFLQLSFHRPHPPLDAPKFYRDLYKRVNFLPPVVGDWADKNSKYTTTVHGQYGTISEPYYSLMKESYYGLITHIDYQVGRLVKFLQENKLANDTLIIFTSDHGEMLGDHHMFRKATPFKGSEAIPMIVHGPGIKKGISDKLVTHIDLMPTILNYVDGQENEGYDGIDILSKANRDYFIGEHPFDKGWNFVIDENNKFIWDSVSGEEWLFDLKDDPNELINLANNNHPSLSTMRKKLVDSFKQRNLIQFIENDNLKAGMKLPSYDPNVSIK